jgi:phosphatidylserine synthase
MATFAFAACAITRLAFYNVSQDTIPGFIGIPVPVAALITSSVLLAGPSSVTAAIVMVVAGAAMVMPVPIPRPTGYGLALFVLWPLTLVALHLA